MNNDLAKYKILIIGASGFVGSYLKSHFSKDTKVLFTYSKNSIEGGILYDAFENSLSTLPEIADVNLVINCYSPKQDHTIENVCKATTDLANFINSKSRWLINVSSVSSLYENRLNDEYSFKKFIIDEIVQYYIKPDLYTILRFAQIFDYEGRGRNSQPGLYFLIDKIKKNLDIELFNNYKSLQRNFIPVELVIKAIEFCINSGIKGIHNAIIEKHTKGFKKLITSLSDKDEDVKTSVGSRIGLKYFIPSVSEQLKDWAGEAEDIAYYFSKIYNDSGYFKTA